MSEGTFVMRDETLNSAIEQDKRKEARIAALERENKQLREALKPFAKFADVAVLPESSTYPMFDFPGARITVGDFRKAKAALAAHVPAGNGDAWDYE